MFNFKYIVGFWDLQKKLPLNSVFIYIFYSVPTFLELGLYLLRKESVGYSV